MRTYSYMGIFTALFVAVLPFLISNTLFYASENIKFFFFIGFVDLLLIWAGINIWNKTLAFSSKNRWLFATSVLVIIVEYIASIFGVNTSHSLWSDIVRSTGVLFVTHVFIGAYVLAMNLREVDWSLLRRSVAISAALFSFFVFLGIDGFGLTTNFLWFSFLASGLTIGNTTFAAAYSVLALILTLIEISRTKEHNSWFWGLVTCAVLILISPLLIGSNLLFDGTTFSDVLHSPSSLIGSGRSSSIVAYALLIFMGGIVLLRKLPEKIRNISTWTWATTWLLGITVGLILLFTPGTALQNEYIKISTAARILLWQDAAQGIADRPLLGWGPENFVYAFEAHFNNELYKKENNNEIWFDRAHNVFVDTLIGSGIIGVTVFALLIVTAWWTIRRSYKKGNIGYYEAVLLAVLPVAHIVQHQTAFDTTVTYALLAVIGGYLLFLEHRLEAKEQRTILLSPNITKGLSLILIVLALVSAKYIAYDQWVRQNALFASFHDTTQMSRITHIQQAFQGHPDFEMLRLSSAAFSSGLITQIRNNSLTQASFNSAQQLIDIYANEYKGYIEKYPDYYRAHLDYAYLLFMKTMLGNDSLEEAKILIKNAYPLAPGNPLTYGMDALAETYGGHFQEAKAKADAGLALNPTIDFSKRIRAYVDDQQRSFPTITILELENI